MSKAKHLLFDNQPARAQRLAALLGAGLVVGITLVGIKALSSITSSRDQLPPADENAPKGIPPDVEVGHDTSRVNARTLIWSGIGLAGLVVFALIIVSLLTSLIFTTADRPSAAQFIGPDASVPQPPEPRLQSSPPFDWKRFLAEEQAELNSYSWVDRERGVVGIPIDRSIELLVERGLPVRTGSGDGQINSADQARNGAKIDQSGDTRQPQLTSSPQPTSQP